MKNVIVMGIGGTNISTGIMNSDKELMLNSVNKLPIIKTSHQLNQIIFKNIKEVQKKFDDEIHAISISVAGPLRMREKSFFFVAHNVLINVVDPVRKKFSLPVYLINDTDAGTIAIFQKIYPRKNNLAYILMSTGIGVGAIMNGQLLHGNTGNAGEFGGSTVCSEIFNSPKTWEECCAITRSESSGIMNFYKEWALYNKKPINKDYKEPDDLFNAYKNGAPDVYDFIDEFNKINAQGVTNVIFAYDPEIVVFGGYLAQNHYDIIVEGVSKYIDKQRFSPMPKLTKSMLNLRAPLYGAGYNFFNRL